MAVFISPVEVTPGTAGAWTDVDVSAYVPAGATGVILQFDIDDGVLAQNVGFRQNGSTDNRINTLAANCMFWCAVGVDSSRMFEGYVSNTGFVSIYLHGYFTADAAFFTNAPDKSLGITGAWTDISIASDTGADTAVGAILEVLSASISWGVRKNGSTDNRISYYSANHSAAVIGVDGTEIFEGQIGNVSCDFFLLGYIKGGASFETNGIDRSLTTPGTWQNLPVLASGAVGAIYEVIQSDSTAEYGFRQDGNTSSILSRPFVHAWGISGAVSQIVEGRISATSVDFFQLGHFNGVTIESLAGTITGSSVLSGSLKATAKIKSLLTAAGNTTGELQALIRMAGLISGSSSSQAVSKRTRKLSGIFQAQNATTGKIALDVGLFGPIENEAKALGRITFDKRALIGTVEVEAIMSGQLTTIALSGLVSGVSALSTSLSVGLMLGGLISGISSVTADLATTKLTMFGEYATGDMPDDWTVKWDNDNQSWTVEADATATRGRNLKHTSTITKRRVLSWDAIGTVTDAEITARLRASSSAGYQLGLIIRGAGPSSSSSFGYRILFRNGDEVQLVRSDPALVVLDTKVYTWESNKYYHVRFSVIGSTLEAKVWKDGEDEPGSPLLTAVDTTYSEGFIGVTTFEAGTHDFDFVGIGTNGLTAPTPLFLRGEAEGMAAVAGTIDISSALRGAIPGTTTVEGRMIAARELVSTAICKGVGSGSLSIDWSLAGTTAGLAVIDGFLMTSKSITGSADALTAVTGKLRANVPVAGSIPVVSAISARLDISAGMTGAMSTQANVNARLTFETLSLTGSVQGQIAHFGLLTVPKVLEGITTLSVTFSALLGLLNALQGQTISMSDTAGKLFADVSLEGLADVRSTFAGILRADVPITGEVPGTSAGGGALSTFRQLVGDIAGQPTATGDPRVFMRVLGDTVGDSGLVGFLSAGARMESTITALGQVIGAVSVFIRLSGAMPGASEQTGSLRILEPIEGATSASSTTTGDITRQRGLWSQTLGFADIIGTARNARRLPGAIHATSTASGFLDRILIALIRRIDILGRVRNGRAPLEEDFDMYAGETLILSCRVVDRENRPVDITGASFRWEVQRDQLAGQSTSIMKTSASGIAVEDDEGGRFHIELAPGDTDGKSGAYYHECRMTDSLNHPTSIFAGRMTIIRTVIG